MAATRTVSARFEGLEEYDVQTVKLEVRIVVSYLIALSSLSLATKQMILITGILIVATKSASSGLVQGLGCSWNRRQFWNEVRSSRLKGRHCFGAFFTSGNFLP